MSEDLIDELDIDNMYELEEISEVNENPQFKMQKPNDDCGCVNGLESVIYGPENVRDELYKALKHGYKSKEYKGLLEENPWWGVHVNGRPDIQHFQYIWNSHLVESILYDSDVVLKELYRTAVKKFKRVNRNKLLGTIKRILLDDEKIYTVKVSKQVLIITDSECKQSIIKALSFITDWLCACYCFEETFWLNVLQLANSAGFKDYSKRKIEFQFRNSEPKPVNKATGKKELTLHERMQKQRTSSTEAKGIDDIF